MRYYPVNLYRFQFHLKFTFYDAISLLPYLKNLGIDTIYCSPFFQAMKGSMHGYDVTNPLQFNEELGGEEGFTAFQKAAHALGFGIVLDLVANHMAASVENPWWYDILEKGSKSPYAAYFDIDWNPQVKTLCNKILLPILDVPSKEALTQGKIKFVSNEKGGFIEAMGLLLPINKESSFKSIEVQSLLEKQHYFLEFWQYAPQNINYRRFFDINGLAALKMDHKKTFEHYHKLTLELLSSGRVQGLRIDHPDGIYEPYHYFKSLHSSLEKKLDIKLYIVVEKILERDENLPEKWPVDGTVGYEYLNLINQLFVDRDKEDCFTKLYHLFIEEDQDREKLLQGEKRNFALLNMPSEMQNMASKLFQSKRRGDFTKEQLEEAIIELYVFFPVYRTYLEKGCFLMTSEEKEELFEAFDKARLSKSYLDPSFTFLDEIFFHKRDLEEIEEDFIMRFQQIGPSIMAKGFEDTHLYNYNRFIALNEVGSSPHHFGETIEAFHNKITFKQKKFPYGWVTAATHDTKRSHELRLRLNVLSEIFDEWKEVALFWKKENKRYKHESFPDSNREYFLYQTLVGIWPAKINTPDEKKLLVERIKNYLIKASRESKAYTNWMHHHVAYENALLAFIDKILEESSSFYNSLCAFVDKIDRAASLSALSCLNLSLGLPAPLDIYQGTELWDFSLVDPDNRRAVDYEKRKQLLEEIEIAIVSKTQKKWIAFTLEKKNLEPLKMYLFKVGLHLRKTYQELFLEGEYIPLTCKGKRKDHIVAYLRKTKKACALVISTRFLYHYHSQDFWQDTVIELPKDWKNTYLLNVYTQDNIHITETLLIKDIFHVLPFAMLMNAT